MRAVQAFTNTKVFNGTLVELLVWRLSVLKDRYFGFKTVLYTTQEDKQFLEQNKLLDLYDEVNYIQKDKYIDYEIFWAAIKLQAIQVELNKKLDEFFIHDIDLVLMSSRAVIQLKKPILMWASEQLCFKDYPALAELRNSKIVLPTYMRDYIIPYNVAIFKITYDAVIQDYLDITFYIMHKLSKDTDSSLINNIYLMALLEQRLLANIIEGKYFLKADFITDNQQTKNFNEDSFHIYYDKYLIRKMPEIHTAYLKDALTLLKILDTTDYNIVMQLYKDKIRDALKIQTMYISKLHQYIC